MLRIIGIGVGVCIVAFVFGFGLFVSSDVGSIHLDKGGKSDSLIVLIHGLAGPESISNLKKLTREQFPDADILTSSYSPSPFSNIDPYRLTNTIEHQIHEADRQAKYEKIILVGHSLGAVLLRKAFVWAHGAEQDRAPRFGFKGPRSWPDKTVRFISLAGINRGWSLDPKPEHLSNTKFILAHIGVFIAELTGTGDLVMATRRGAPFISDLRVQWIQLARQQVYKDRVRKLPLSIHLIGDIDDVVSGRVAKVRNVVATADWVVALFPRFFEQIADWGKSYETTGYLDIGSAGFRGFEDSAKADPLRRIADTKFVSGGHSAALDFRDEAKLKAIVDFALNGRDDGLVAFKNADEPDGWLDLLSNISWIVWLTLAALLALLGYAALTYGGRIVLGAYVLILLGLLLSF
jgi:hypothetical protein